MKTNTVKFVFWCTPILPNFKAPVFYYDDIVFCDLKQGREKNADIKNFIRNELRDLATRDQVDKMGYDEQRNMDDLEKLRGVVERLEQDTISDRRSPHEKITRVVHGRPNPPATRHSAPLLDFAPSREAKIPKRVLTRKGAHYGPDP